MSRRKKNVGCLGTILTICFMPFALIFDSAMNYKPLNSKGRKISRKKKRKWF